MARIRSIKPEFWTSEQIVECSPNARLLFIGIWNFCDDYGVHPAKCATLKMRIFPSDSFSVFDVKGMVAEIIAAKLMVEYEVDGELFWHVTGWDRHQRVDMKTGKYPLPNGKIGSKVRRPEEDSTNIRRTTSERSVTEKEKEKEKEKDKEKEKEKEEASLSSIDNLPNCPHGEIVDLYHRYLPANPRMKVWNGDRAKSLMARWREDPKRQSIDYWERFFKHCSSSLFLTGRTEGAQGRPFLPGLDWMVKASNFAKIIENRYHERQQ